MSRLDHLEPLAAQQRGRARPGGPARRRRSGCSCAPHLFAGSSTRIVVPAGDGAGTAMEPPCACTMSRVMARPETGAAAPLPGGDERLEDAARRARPGCPGPLSATSTTTAGARAGHRHLDAAAAGGRLERVAQQVVDHQLELDAVAVDRRGLVGAVDDGASTPARSASARTCDHLVPRHRPPGRRAGARTRTGAPAPAGWRRCARPGTTAPRASRRSGARGSPAGGQLARGAARTRRSRSPAC